MARLDPLSLRAAAQAVPEAGVSLGELLASAPGGQLPAMIVLCTLPAALPGLQLGWVCVPVLLYLAVALWRGQQQPRIPQRLAEVRVSRKAAHGMLNAFAWVLEKSGGWCRATWPALVRRTRRRPAAVLVAAMALVILLPLPGSNIGPAVAIVVLMGGLVWRDGRAIVAAVALSIASVLIVAGLTWAAWAAVAFWW